VTQQEGEAMARVSHGIALTCGVAATALGALAGAQQQVYRYVDKDGRVIYSDRAPPADSKEIQAKRLTPNFIENNDLPVATSQAAQRFPVTLYTFSCGQVCQNAEGLLNRRGIPFTTVNVEDQKGSEQLQKLTGAQQAPVLQVGDKLIAKGFNEARWTAMLDDAGYPKSAPRRVAVKATGAAAVPAPAATAAAAPAATAAAAPAPAPAPDSTQSVAVPGGGYPKQ
jgi:glutaredoxin